ncbi:MAG: sulfatase-like hydrolase/transferase, partial [Opitutae bacterium]
MFNITTSHESQIRKRPHNAVHDPSKVRVPAYHPDHPAVRQDWAQYYDKMTEMDVQVGQRLEELEKAGLTENTLIFYYGDHGSGMPRSKRWPYFSGLNVPLVIHVPEKWKHLAPPEYKPGGSTDRRVGFVDLAPTLLSIAGVKPPSHMQGHAFMGKHATPPQEYAFGFRGRMDERYDMVRSVLGKRYIYIRNYMPHKPYGQHVNYMFITPTTQVWKQLYDEGKLNAAQSHFWKTKPAEELYDLHADPDEVNNLAVGKNQKKHKDVLDALRRAHKEHIAEIRDIGFLPEGEIHSRSTGSTPYEMGHNGKKFPYKRIHAAANLASSMRKEDLGKIAKLLEDGDSAVRYWG